MTQYLAVDIGGTFTDAVVFNSDGSSRLGKALTTPHDLVQGVMASLRDGGADLSEATLIVHGSTLVINALIERKGVKTALLTTAGTRDIYEIGRINRPDSFNLRFRRPVPLVPRRWRLEVDERMAAGGGVVDELDESSVVKAISDLRDGNIESVAVTLLHSYANPAHETRIAEIVREQLPDVYVCCSHEISREYREYERTSTTVANAYVGPIVEGYLGRLSDTFAAEGFSGSLLIMQSNGGLMDAPTASRQCIQMLESGPAGGVNGVATLCRALDLDDAIAFDMGGTTAKATVLRGGRAEMAEEYFVGDYASGLPLRVPAIDVKEVGTGGGSIAWLDEARGFHVGPRSAGASPGPAAYGMGGTQATVTDANIVLGRLDAGNFSGVGVKLDRDLAEEAVQRLAGSLGLTVQQAALGILEIATASMADAVRAVTVKRGLDPRDFTLVAYGGAGPLHAGAVAQELGCRKLVIPRAAGVFSAYGMLSASLRRDVVRSCFVGIADPGAADALHALYTSLDAETAQAIAAGPAGFEGVTTQWYADVRYVGQEHTLTIPVSSSVDATWLARLKNDFDLEHGVVYAHSAPDEPAQLVTVRVSAAAQLAREGVDAAGTASRPAAAGPTTRAVTFDDPNRPLEVPVWQRQDFPVATPVDGPLVIEDTGTSLLVWPGSAVTQAPDGSLIIEQD